jgi:hypothetical protein
MHLMLVLSTWLSVHGGHVLTIKLHVLLTILLAQIFLGGLVANAVGSSFLQRLE